MLRGGRSGHIGSGRGYFEKIGEYSLRDRECWRPKLTSASSELLSVYVPLNISQRVYNRLRWGGNLTKKYQPYDMDTPAHQT